ncbi:hypothetical protein [Corynebacterium riegelii]|uniref:Secreted protein n=1 Tax=Corynebacterium riegelii TaxID=156976 RepID=A0A0K1RDB1_9CORY|nr:hypothetical protein [Corynebacterium riegelii]AKV59409.1 hypothetical protein AK829_09985 [Corynebacterium riegelii]
MKRITTAAVAAATALSLVATPAFAEDNKGGSSNENQGSSQQQDKEGDKGGSSKDGETKKKSSELSDQDAIDYANKKSDELTGLVKKAAEKDTPEEREKALKPLISSLKSDAAQGWAPGTTADILLGTGITAALLALIAFVVNSGLVPGLQLPF